MRIRISNSESAALPRKGKMTVAGKGMRIGFSDSESATLPGKGKMTGKITGKMAVLR